MATVTFYFWHVLRHRAMSDLSPLSGCKAEDMCSWGVLLSLTLIGHSHLFSEP